MNLHHLTGRDRFDGDCECVENPTYWSTREELRLAIVVWIERTYHRRRRQRALGRLTPIEFEMMAPDRVEVA